MQDYEATVGGWAEPILRQAFGDDLESWSLVRPPTEMGFSGAVILDLRLGIRNAEPRDPRCRVVLKKNECRGGRLAPGTSDVERHKAQRTDQSYANEIAFLDSLGSDLLRLGVRIATTHLTSSGDNFIILAESFAKDAGWHQHIELSAGKNTHAVLRWLAKFHAAFLPKSRGGGGLEVNPKGVWEYGTHQALRRRPDWELPQTAQVVAATATAFASADPYFERQKGWAEGGLAERLQNAAARVAEELDVPAASARGVVTMVHGDFKAANLFISEEEEGGLPYVGLIDWQWTGPGVGALDLGYLCCQCLSDSTVDNWEEEVLKVYHGELVAALGGSKASYPYDTLRREFALSVIDFFRWTAGSRLGNHNPQRAAKNRDAQDINRGEYLRSPKRLAWMFERSEAFMEEYDL
eukprot:Hpha_TRINITY_DN3499_c0_g1::TRINITY_DN3499_c0_g1_i1::g.32631::m.32631